MPAPVETPAGVKCYRCGKKIAEQIGSGTHIDCRHCGAANRK